MSNSVLLTNISPEQLSENLRNIVREELSLLVTATKDEKDQYHTRKEAARKLNISLPTLNEYTKRGIITAYRFGSRVLYKDVDIENALKEVITSKFK